MDPAALVDAADAVVCAAPVDALTAAPVATAEDQWDS